MSKFLKHLNNFEEYMLVILLPAMCAAIFLSTFMRFTNLLVIPWAEELTRYMMIWMMFFGISAAAKRGEHFCITAFVMLLPLPFQKFVGIIRILLMTGFTLFITRFCIVILRHQMMMGQLSPALKVPMWTMYSAIIVGCVLMLFRYTVFGIRELREKKGE